MEGTDGSSHRAELIGRIQNMKCRIDNMRKKLKEEKKLLNMEKMQVKDLRRPDSILNRSPSQPFPRQDLQDIEEKCGVELVKMNRYISSIRELRKHWNDVRAKGRSESSYAVGDHHGQQDGVAMRPGSCGRF